jgi:hypothetical protein
MDPSLQSFVVSPNTLSRLVVALGVAVLFLTFAGVMVGHALRRKRPRSTTRPATPRSDVRGASRAVPAPAGATGPAPSRRASALEEKLLVLCRGNRVLLEDLLSYERSRHPTFARAALLQLAIEHIHQDNR